MKLPNSPNSPPLLQKLHWIADPVGYMDAAAQDYPDLFRAQVVGFGSNLVYVNHPQAIQQILNDTKQFSAPGKWNEILQPLLGDYSVIMLDGNPHQRQRKLLMPPFHGERLRAYSQLVCDITEQVMSQWKQGKPFSARSAMQDISLQVILEAVFGIYEGERYQELKRLLGIVTDLFRSPLTSSLLFFRFVQRDLGKWSPWGYFLRLQRQIDELLYTEIRERREQPNPERTDILSMLMAARDEAGKPMADQELHDELLTLLFAGHETTASAMAWSLYWVHHQPEVKEKLLEELDSLGESPDPMSISQLPYLTAVCQETLRIYPVGMLTFPREVKEPAELIGYELEPGTVLVGCIYLIHHREDLYPDSKQFKPERFLEHQFSPYEFIPFGGGNRRCVGAALAMLEMKLVLATILSNNHLTLADSKPVKPQRRGVTLAPGEVKMVKTGTRKPQEQPSEPVTSN